MNNEKKPKISVIIGSYNQCSVLSYVLPFYEEQSCDKSDFEVIVVDSTSTDGSVGFLESFKPNFQFKYQIQKNQGKAIARNNAAQLANGDILLITDADMIPDKNFIEGHIRAHQTSNQPSCYEGLAWNLETLRFPPSRSSLTPQVGIFPKHMASLGWYYFLTGNISIPKALFMMEKGFNPIFSGYGWEDLELGYRLSKKNIPLYYLKTSVNYHYHCITKEDEIKRNCKKGESAVLFLNLHPELKWFLGLNPLSLWFFSSISEDSKVFQFFKYRCYQSQKKSLHRLGFWFLKEFNYINGARKMLKDQAGNT